jgi:ribosomal protein S18 acetylase RimI-like enzyme
VTTEQRLIDAYCDLVPRAAADQQEIGGFTLFVGRPGRTYYARPTIGSTTPPTREDIEAVLQRQRELAVPEEFEWVHETCPELGGIARAAGLSVRELPLMALRTPLPAGVPHGYRVRVLPADDPALPATLAAIGVAFGTPGTDPGAAGTAERDNAIADDHDPGVRATTDQIRAGLFVLVAADSDAGPVAGGSHSPRGPVTEITGVATLPAHRRRGLGGAVTLALCAQAKASGVELCFLSADSDAVARVYARVGFVRVGTSCLAAPGRPAFAPGRPAVAPG